MEFLNIEREKRRKEMSEEELKEKVAIGEHHGVKFYNISPLLLDPVVCVKEGVLFNFFECFLFAGTEAIV